MSHPFRLALLLAVIALVPCLGGCGGDEPTDPASTPYSGYSANTPYTAGAGSTAGLGADLAKQVDAALLKGKELLLSEQAENGAWGDSSIGLPPNGGYAAMAVMAIVGATPRTEVAASAPIRKALEFLAGLQNDEGAIFDNPALVNYITSAAVGAFSAAKIPAFRQNEAKGREFLVQSQIAGDEANASYGGFPYKQDQGQAADLSNVQFALTALADAGLEQDHPVWQRALVFLGRMQNRSESNTYVGEVEIDGQTRTVKSGDDGGAYYLPAGSKAGYIERADGTVEPRSYGSMTYALLKCLLLSGIDAKDPRVLAALGWITDNFALDRNPGFETATDAAKAGQQGWYYYAFTLARTLGEYEALTKAPLAVKDAEGNAHNWRAELAQALLTRRGEDGWWMNDVAERWDEGSRVLATSYAMQALAELSGRHR